MGNCISTKTISTGVDDVPAAPHPQARRLWLISTPVDSRDIPLDLVGIDSDGLKAALRNRGLEADHWALKIDPPPSSSKLEASIFDITLQRGTLVAQLHPASSPYWKTVTRRIAIGWTIWTDDEVVHASKQLVQARPKYDGRSNNSQQLARLLARHVEFVAPATSLTAGEEREAARGGSEMKENRSQMTLVSSQRSQSIEEEKVSSSSMRTAHRMSSARPPLIHLSTAPTEVGGAADGLVRPVLQRSAETEAGAATGSMRAKAQARFSQQLQTVSSSSPLNPSRGGTHRASASEVRARTSSDAAYATERRISTVNARGAAARRRSEAPAEWMVDPAHQFSSVRSRSMGRNAHRESVMSLGGGSIVGSPTMGWPAQGSPSMLGLPTLPSVSGMPMAGMPTMPAMGMPMFPQSGSFMFNPSLQIPYLPYAMPMLAPPSPGFHSKASSGVPTPPESPHGSTMHLPKHEFGYAFGQHHQQHV